MWSGPCVATGLLLLFGLNLVFLLPETNYCHLKNCPADKKLPHIGCNNSGVRIIVWKQQRNFILLIKGVANSVGVWIFSNLFSNMAVVI